MITLPLVGSQSIVMSISVCLSLCPHSHISETTCPALSKISLSVVMAWSSSGGIAVLPVFVDDLMFAHNGHE